MKYTLIGNIPFVEDDVTVKKTYEDTKICDAFDADDCPNYMWSLIHLKMVMDFYSECITDANNIPGDDDEAMCFDIDKAYLYTVKYFGYEEIRKLMDFVSTSAWVSNLPIQVHEAIDMLKKLEKYIRYKIPVDTDLPAIELLKDTGKNNSFQDFINSMNTPEGITRIPNRFALGK